MLNPHRFDVLYQILQLDPKEDCQAIVQLVGRYEYPWLTRKALEFALFRTYAVPSIGQILDESGQFVRHGQRRYDDTALLIAEFTEHGYDSERGRRAIRRMNQLHRRWQISNQDYLYVLSTFIYIPTYWHERFGWRKPTHHENLANYHFWVAVGQRMGIRDIPETYEAFEDFHLAYERENFRYTPQNRRVADATIQIFLDWYPRILHPLIREGMFSLMDDPLREAFGYPKAHSLVHVITHTALKLNGWLLRHLMPPRRKPFLLTEQSHRSYPAGYVIEHMGPPDDPVPIMDDRISKPGT